MYIFQKKLGSMLFRTIVLGALIVYQICFCCVLNAQAKSVEGIVDYGESIVVDSDLDGLSDEGEKQLFKTDPGSPDSDKDGFFDGTEILNGTDPLEYSDPAKSGIVNLTEDYLERETPWAWFLSRASGFLAYIFLWLSILFGLAIRNIFLKKVINPAHSFELHNFTSISAVFWALLHGVSFLFHDSEYSMNLGDIFIPLYSQHSFFDSNYLALGIIAFYVLVVIVFTSFIRSKISYKIWKVVHSLNLFLVPLLAIHVILLGTDMQYQAVRYLFIASLILLVPLYSSSLLPFLWKKMKNKTQDD